MVYQLFLYFGCWDSQFSRGLHDADYGRIYIRCKFRLPGIYNIVKEAESAFKVMRRCVAMAKQKSSGQERLKSYAPAKIKTEFSEDVVQTKLACNMEKIR